MATATIFKTPFAGLLPPLSTAERDALKRRIQDEGGIHDPVLIAEDDVVLDGHTRLSIDPDAPTKVIPGSVQWSEAQRKAFVIRCNQGRRNLSDDQGKGVDRTSKQVALELKKEGKTQSEIASMFGVSQQWVSKWINGTTNTTEGCNGCNPRLDNRVKVQPAARDKLFERVESGEAQAQVAADYGVSQQMVSKIVKQKQKEADLREQERRAVAESTVDPQIYNLDFRLANVEAGSLDFIFADPPYSRENVDLYGDLARFAAHSLRSGCWCLAYVGQLSLLDAGQAMAANLSYGWTFACQHSGGDGNIRMFHLKNKWKPILGFYKEPRAEPTWKYFPDVVSGGREKSHHKWQQAESEAAHFIENMTVKNALVCDPFCGSGTTCVAAKRLGRRWLGFDVDPTAVKSAKARLATQEIR